MIERANQSILNGITKLQAEHGYGVDEARRVKTRIYNARVHKSTGHSLFKIVIPARNPISSFLRSSTTR
jgi:hypothetical protein